MEKVRALHGPPVHPISEITIMTSPHGIMGIHRRLVIFNPRGHFCPLRRFFSPRAKGRRQKRSSFLFSEAASFDLDSKREKPPQKVGVGRKEMKNNGE